VIRTVARHTLRDVCGESFEDERHQVGIVDFRD
jgi:hypothetical protein